MLKILRIILDQNKELMLKVEKNVEVIITNTKIIIKQ